MKETLPAPGVAAERFRAARDFLFAHREDYDTAYGEFRWPVINEFNWALDWFDLIAAEHGERLALWIVEQNGDELKRSFRDMSERSNQVANWLREHGVHRGDRILVMLGSQVELWEVILAAMKLGAVIIPATLLLGPSDLVDRIARGKARHVVATAGDAAKFDEVPGGYTRVAVGDAVGGWLHYGDADRAPATFAPDGPTAASDTLLLYFTSGTTAEPKLVEHSHVSYPVGHLSTMYWVGIQPGDVHLNISSPGWAKHAWSNVYAPWIAEATVMVFNYARFDAKRLLEQMVRCGVSTFCAPPTVWRMLIQEDLSRWPVSLREAVAAGEPLNPEVIEQVRRKWGITVRDGYGQTETTAIIGNTPGQPVKLGSMGRPLPGYSIGFLDPATGEPADEGEIAIDLSRRPLGLMSGYHGASGDAAAATEGDYYGTSDVASRDGDGYITYIGRNDDVFKASDYRISPFELESVLIEHEAVAEAAIVPSPDPTRLAVPKAYVTLAHGHEPTRETALAIMRFAREQLAPYKRIRRLEFSEVLPKTISGKIRRVDLRNDEHARLYGSLLPTARAPHEFWEEDFPELERGRDRPR